MTMKPKSMKRLLAEVDALASLDIDDFDEAMDDLIEARARRFERYRLARQTREYLLNKIANTFSDSPESRCIAALRACKSYGGVSSFELNSLRCGGKDILARLAEEGYPVREIEREEVLVTDGVFVIGRGIIMKPLPSLPDDGRLPRGSWKWGTDTVYVLA